jgi:hypothetical protein
MGGIFPPFNPNVFLSSSKYVPKRFPITSQLYSIFFGHSSTFMYISCKRGGSSEV